MGHPLSVATDRPVDQNVKAEHVGSVLAAPSLLCQRTVCFQRYLCYFIRTTSPRQICRQVGRGGRRQLSYLRSPDVQRLFSHAVCLVLITKGASLTTQTHIRCELPKHAIPTLGVKRKGEKPS